MRPEQLNPLFASVTALTGVGPRIAKLLGRLALDEEELRYVGRILTACRDDQQARTGRLPEHAVQIEVAAGRQPLLTPLTKRELEILGMLGKRLSNKEIASQLNIAPATVKRHTENVYDKLGVGGRREAVAKARALGILSKN